MQANVAITGAPETVAKDLGPLAWVLDELRKSLDGANKALRRFVRDAEMSRGSDLGALDASQLRIARQQLHQAVGALEMVGMAAPAKVLRAMEALAQKFVQRPELCSGDAAAKVERASFALVEYLEGVLKGKEASSVALFPQYRDVMVLVGDERVHPADLWPFEFHWPDITVPQPAAPLAYDSSVRTRLDNYVLKVVKTGDKASAGKMRGVSLGFAAAQTDLEHRVFWTVCAGYFEAVSLSLCPADVYGKRAATRILLQYRTLARGEPVLSDRLIQDLLFFCAQAVPENPAEAPVLTAVRSAYGLTQARSLNYTDPQFGRFDPAVLVQARKRVAAAIETWSALAGGDTNRLKLAIDQFSLVADSILKLNTDGAELAKSLTKAIEVTARSGEAPVPSLAMEVATTVLYLEASYEDMDPMDSHHMAQRSASLASRLAHVTAGGEPEPLEPWMEELYRRVSDRQIMGSVVDELRTALSDVEHSLDQFFRNPHDRVPLHEVPSQLAQMRGVFSVLGLDQAALATLRMRASVEKFLVDEVDTETASTGIFEKLGNSLGALGFLIDMLSYQRELAKKLFVYDEELGEFKPLMGRGKTLGTAAGLRSDVAPLPVVSASADARDQVAVPAPQQEVQASAELPDVEEEEPELKDIFLEEAREVVQTGSAAIVALSVNAADLEQQTTLRRAFHTLKGSSRMVGLNEFGEAAWSLEQVINAWLADQKPVSTELIELASRAMTGFGRWVEDIANESDAPWSAQIFRAPADSLRIDNLFVDFVFPGEAQPDLAAEEVVQSDFGPTEVRDFEVTQVDDSALVAPAGVEGTATPQDLSQDAELEFDFDFNGVSATMPASVPLEAVADAQQELAPDLHGLADSIDEDREPAVTPAEATSAQTFEQEIVEAAAQNVPELHEEAAHDLAQDEREGHPEAQADSLMASDPDDQVKLIGSLRIGIALYNVYLNEADEWSRRLLTEINEWALELHQPIADSTVALAHSLAGSSATVGFMSLSEIARALEHAMQHVQLYAQGTAEHAGVFASAAEDIRRLLHQFAAGFLKESDPAIIATLKDILETEFVAPEPESLDSQYPDTAMESDARVGQEQDVWEGNPEETEEPRSALAFDEPAGVRPTVAESGSFPLPQTVPPVPYGATAQSSVSPRVDFLATDALDVDLFPIFEEEALELLPQLGGALRQWTARPSNLGARRETLRVLHTLKGSARLAGAMHLGEMAHCLESEIEALADQALQAAGLEPLLAQFDALEADFHRLRATPESALSLPETSRAPDEATSFEASTAQPSAELAASRQVLAIPAIAPLAPIRQGSTQTVRVRAQLLDRLVNQAGEVLITRSRLEARLGQLRVSLDELTGNLSRLRSQLRDIELQSESQMQSRLAQAKDSAQGFDPLEFDRFTRVQELTRMMAESVHDVATVQRNLQRTVEGTEDDLIAQARQARDLQRDLLRTRMVEFEGIAERLHGVVRQASKEAGKQVQLEIQGGSIDIDRGVLERMVPAFEHLLRNAVVHGIEEPGLREKAGKPATGTITIALHQQSNDVTVAFSDDGAGLDIEQIRNKALSLGEISGTQSLTDAELVNLIFGSGFSTASQVTQLAGRGVGLDVVRSEINALGGRIQTTTECGQGTRFELVLPLTTAVTQVVMLRIGELVVGVPANLVEMVRRVPVAALESAYRDKVFDFGGEQVPFFWGGSLLQASVQSDEARTKTLAVAIFRSAGQRVAMHLDEVLGNQEAVVKNLGPQLSRLPGLAGVSVLASGAVVLIYNPVALASVYGEQARQLTIDTELAAKASIDAGKAMPSTLAGGQGHAPLVLVVDDSITVRRVTQRLLKREGFRVTLAADGLQALECLQVEKPAVVLSDIEMPRMDGFDLTRNIRGDARLADLPVIMITSRIAEKHREHARELGVNHYLGKPYSEDELIALVRQFCLAAEQSN